MVNRWLLLLTIGLSTVQIYLTPTDNNSLRQEDYILSTPSSVAPQWDTLPDSLYRSTTLTPPHTFTQGIEGPVVDQSGLLYAVNYDTAGTIGVVNAQGEASLFVRLPEGSIGNGIRFDQRGRMFVADYRQHNVLRVDMTTQKVSVFAHEARMNQPNDLANHPSGYPVRQ